MKNFEKRAKELMRTNPDDIRNMAKSENKYERSMAEIILETVGEIV